MSVWKLCTEAEAELQGMVTPAARRRRRVLHETLAAFDCCTPRDHYLRLAQVNLERWAGEATELDRSLRVHVIGEDWGVVTQALSKRYGRCIAVLNMVNAHAPGGAYRTDNGLGYGNSRSLDLGELGEHRECIDTRKFPAQPPRGSARRCSRLTPFSCDRSCTRRKSPYARAGSSPFWAWARWWLLTTNGRSG